MKQTKATPPVEVRRKKERKNPLVCFHFLSAGCVACRFVQLPSGSLQIHNVSLSDGGSYRCMAAQNFNHLNQVTSLKWKWSQQALLNVQPGA